ncbi:MAG: 3-phosphoshikimate 1-carboxyvinyltransferase [Peptococcaceae bacterium]|nr:3-phosphoshikimate 1-carboxyvinyltransferase [Peptococcaceae bacterium]
MDITIFPGKSRGAVTVPPSKSMAHRAIICAALAQEGISRIENINYSQDILATIQCLKQLGAEITCEENSLIVKGGISYHGLNEAVHCNESGSTLRFLIPLFALKEEKTVFTGEGRLLQRPQTIYQDIFRKQGLLYAQNPENITIQGRLKPGVFEVPGNISSQFISGLLFALPLLEGDSLISILPPFESQSYLKLTLDLLKQYGIEIQQKDKFTLLVPGNQSYCSHDYRIEGDYSQGAFWSVLSAINSPISCMDLPEDSAQGDKAILTILQQCGAKISAAEKGKGLTVIGGQLIGREIDLADCPDLGPILMVLALFCQGKSRIYHAKRLRYKESDRIAAMEAELRKLGADITSTEDEIFITPKISYQAKELIETHGDHRIAMAMAIAATKCQNSVTISHGEVVEKSYPNFWEHLENLEIQVEKHD